MDSIEVFFLILSCIDDIPFPNDMILDLIEIPDILTDNATVEKNTLDLVNCPYCRQDIRDLSNKLNHKSINSECINIPLQMST